MKFLKKIWFDPVGSAVIAGLILLLITGLGGFLWLWLTNRIHCWAAAIWSVFSIPVPLWTVTFLVIVPFVINQLHKIRRPETSGSPAEEQRRLVIVSAEYQPTEGGGKVFDVTECLSAKAGPNSLFLEIENHNFVVGSKNYVPDDPKPNSEKRLKVTYAVDGGPEYTIERVEHQRLVLPEEVPELLTSLRIELFSIRQDLLHFLGEIGDEPKFDGETGKAFATYLGTKNTYIGRNRAKFDSRFKKRLERVNRRLISEMDILDHEFETAMNSTCNPEMVKKLIDLIWAIAGRLDANPE